MAERNAQGCRAGILDLGDDDAREMVRQGIVNDNTIIALVRAFVHQEPLPAGGCSAMSCRRRRIAKILFPPTGDGEGWRGMGRDGREGALGSAPS